MGMMVHPGGSPALYGLDYFRDSIVKPVLAKLKYKGFTDSAEMDIDSKDRKRVPLIYTLRMVDAAAVNDDDIRVHKINKISPTGQTEPWTPDGRPFIFKQFIEFCDELLCSNIFFWQAGAALQEAEKSKEYGIAGLADFRTFFGADNKGITDVNIQQVAGKSDKSKYLPPFDLQISESGQAIVVFYKKYIPLFYEADFKEIVKRPEPRGIAVRNFFFFRLDPGVQNDGDHKADAVEDWTLSNTLVATIGHVGARASGSLGAARSDDPKEVEYRWGGNRRLGLALGLDEGCYVAQLCGDSSKECAMMLTKSHFYPTNIPWDQDQFLPMKTQTAFFMGSEIIYFKKFPDNAPQNKKNLPLKPSCPVVQRLKVDRVPKLGDMAAAKVDALFRKKQKDRSLEHGNPEKRDVTGAMIREAFSNTSLRGEFKAWLEEKRDDYKSNAAINGAWPATDFGYFFQRKKMDVQQPVPVQREWCHLYGHGDGGKESADNLVAGTKHCNTEQLAIEEGQRKEGYEGLRVKVTAYLAGRDKRNAPLTTFSKVKKSDVEYYLKKYIPRTKSTDQARSAVFDKYYSQYFVNSDSDEKDSLKPRPYADIEPLFPAHRAIFRDQIAKARIAGNRFLESILIGQLHILDGLKSLLVAAYPFATTIRYKIYQGKTKLFDHIYDAQSQSLNYHEFKILRTTVEAVVAQGVGKAEDYRNSINEKLEALGIDEPYRVEQKSIEAIGALMDKFSRGKLL